MVSTKLHFDNRITPMQLKIVLEKEFSDVDMSNIKFTNYTVFSNDGTGRNAFEGLFSFKFNNEIL